MLMTYDQKEQFEAQVRAIRHLLGPGGNFQTAEIMMLEALEMICKAIEVSDRPVYD